MTHAMHEADLKRWMAELGPRLINLSAGICRDRHRAEEIVQEAFIKLWQQPPDAGEIAYRSWMRRVVTNLSINALKRTKRPGPIPEFSSDRALHAGGPAGGRPDQPLESADELHRIRAAMDRLDDSKRVILLLRASEGLSYEEIAEHLGVPMGTVMSRLNRARAALAAELDQPATEPEDEAKSFDISRYRQA